MVKNTSCIFYDGKSSVPKQIDLHLDNENATLFFDTDTDSFRWDIKTVSFTRKATALNIQYGKDIIQNVVIDDVDFIERFIESRKNSGHNSWYDVMISQGFKLHAVLALLIIGMIILSYVYLIPWVGEKSVVLIPEEYDVKIGKMFFDQNMLGNSVDTSKTKALNLFAKELQLNNTKKLNFTVVKSETINAFALPDGSVVVYTGILDKMKDYDELVALLGHEVSHVNHRHSMKMMCRNLSGYLFVSTILGDVNGVMATIGDNVNSLRSLSFSREFEHQADAGSFEIVMQNKVNPRGISNLFKRLEDQSSIIPEFLSSHPVTKERINYINKTIKSRPFAFTDHPKLRTLFKQIKE